jgi:integral membrane sensor domain MASE1
MPSTGTDSPRGNLDLVAKIAAVALLYTIVGKLGLMLDAVSGFATLVWPASGLALAALLLFGNRLWPGVWLGAFIVNLWTGAPWLVAVAIAAGNTLEAVIGSHVFRRWAEFDGRFDRLRHVAGLIVPAAMLSTLASATVGVASLAFAGVVSAHAIVPTWRAWWIGDVLGDLLVAPLLLTWARPATVVLKPLRRAELVLLGAALVGASLAVFFRPRTSVVFPLEGPYILFPLFIWAAVRFELRGAATATVLASAFAIWGTVVGRGPFARASLAESLLALQTFMGCAALTPLVVGGAISDRARLQREAEHARAEALLHSERLQVLADASAALVRVTQDAEAILRETAHYCAELVGDACFILLLSEQDGNLDVVAFHHEDPEYRAFAERLVLGRHLGGSPFCHSVMESASLVILPSVEPHAAAELIDPAFGELVERYPIHGLIAVPLMQRERVTGVGGAGRAHSR